MSWCWCFFGPLQCFPFCCRFTAIGVRAAPHTAVRVDSARYNAVGVNIGFPFAAASVSADHTSYRWFGSCRYMGRWERMLPFILLFDVGETLYLAVC